MSGKTQLDQRSDGVVIIDSTCYTKKNGVQVHLIISVWVSETTGAKSGNGASMLFSGHPRIKSLPSSLNSLRDLFTLFGANKGPCNTFYQDCVIDPFSNEIHCRISVGLCVSTTASWLALHEKYKYLFARCCTHKWSACPESNT
eukprot:1152502-Pelagomonas_calceolata.AAC.3